MTAASARASILAASSVEVVTDLMLSPAYQALAAGMSTRDRDELRDFAKRRMVAIAFGGRDAMGWSRGLRRSA